MSTLTCPKCGSIYEEGKRFCIKDGTALRAGTNCRNCGAQIGQAQQSCSHCGAAPERPATTNQVQPRKQLDEWLPSPLLTLIVILIIAAGAGAGRFRALIGVEEDELPITILEERVGDLPLVSGEAAPGTSEVAGGIESEVEPVPAEHREPVKEVSEPHASSGGRGHVLESELASRGVSGVKIYRRGRTIQLRGAVANDLQLRTVYQFMNDKGFGEVDYGVEIR